MSVMVHMYGDEEEVNRFFTSFETWCDNFEGEFELVGGLKREEQKEDLCFNFTVLYNKSESEE